MGGSVFVISYDVSIHVIIPSCCIHCNTHTHTHPPHTHTILRTLHSRSSKAIASCNVVVTVWRNADGEAFKQSMSKRPYARVKLSAQQQSAVTSIQRDDIETTANTTKTIQQVPWNHDINKGEAQTIKYKAYYYTSVRVHHSHTTTQYHSRLKPNQIHNWW